MASILRTLGCVYTCEHFVHEHDVLCKASGTCVGLTKAFTESVILVADRHVSFHKRFF